MRKTFDIQAIDSRYSGELQLMHRQVSDQDLRIKFEASLDTEQQPEKAYKVIDGIGLYTISGPLLSDGDAYSRWLGYADYPTIRNDVLTMGADPDVKEILLLVKSPGGSVYGISNAALAIKNVDKTKPVFVYSEKTAASGAYWLAAPARKIFCAPEAAAGSIGVIVTHFSYEQYLEKEGIKVTIVKSDELKATGGPYQDLTDKEVAHIQDEVDQYDQLFKAHVAENRPQVQLHNMQAQTFIGQEAVRMGLADAVMSFDDVIGYIRSQRTETQTQGAFSMKFTAVELKTALDAGKTLADLGITEAERDEILATLAAPPSADTEVDKLKADLAAAEILLVESEAKVQDLAGKLEASEAEVAVLKEVQKPSVNAELKKIVCELTDNRRVALGMQKIDMAEFSVDTVLVEYAAVTKAYEKAFVEGGALTKKTETKATSLAGDSIEAGHLQAARF